MMWIGERRAYRKDKFIDKVTDERLLHLMPGLSVIADRSLFGYQFIFYFRS